MNILKKYRKLISLVLVIIVLLAFGIYIDDHPSLITNLGKINPIIIVVLICLYALWFLSICLITKVSLDICQKKVKVVENLILNSYSTLVNFFIPGQGGIAVRGIYFKKAKNLLIRNFIFATLIYYGFYAAISGIMLLGFSDKIWITVSALILIVGISAGVLYIYYKKSKLAFNNFNLKIKPLALLLIATLIQAFIQVTIYGVELHSANKHISITQMITYTGAANFSLFVALTPGAIGIRESFLLFSKRLNHLSSANILTASIIDRSIFLIFLGIIFIISLIIHSKNKLLVTKEE